MKQREMNVLALTRLACALLLLPLVVGYSRICGAQSSSADITASAQREILARVQEPKDLKDILVNLRIALDSGVILRREFYYDPILIRYFGGRKIIWSKQNTDNDITGEISGFDGIVEAIDAPSLHKCCGLGISFDRLVRANRTITARQQWNISETSAVDFAVVEAIFGTDWQDEDNSPSTYEGYLALKPSRGPHGNAKISYRPKNGVRRWDATIIFSADERPVLAGFGLTGANMP
jgi:hypothetical protein